MNLRLRNAGCWSACLLIGACLFATNGWAAEAEVKAEVEPMTLRVGGTWSGYRSLLAVGEKFAVEHAARTTYAGGSNARGFEHLANGKLHVLAYSGHADRLPEEAICQAFGVEQLKDAPQRQHLFGQFVVVVVVHPDNPVRTLSADHLRRVFTGEAKRWKSVDGGGREITPVGEKRRTKGSEIFQQVVMKGGGFSREMKEFQTAEQVAIYVARHPGAIGFYLDRRTQLDDVARVSIGSKPGGPYIPPREDKILAQEYPLTEDLLLFTRDDGPTMAETFCEFARGPQGAEIARSHSLYPGQERIRYEARDRFAMVKSGTAPVARCLGIAEGRALVRDLADSYIRNEGVIAIDYRPSAAASQSLQPTEENEMSLVGTTGVAGDGDGLVLGGRTLGVIVHPENNVGELLVSDLKSIYEGSLLTWPGQEARLQMIGPDSSSIHVEVFRSLIDGKQRDVAYTAKESTMEIIRAVARDKAAIGVIDLSEFPAADTSVRLVPITVAGEQAARLVAGQPVPANYPLARTYTLHVSPKASRATRDFARYLTAPRIAEILKPHGLLPPRQEPAAQP